MRPIRPKGGKFASKSPPNPCPLRQHSQTPKILEVKNSFFRTPRRRLAGPSGLQESKTARQVHLPRRTSLPREDLRIHSPGISPLRGDQKNKHYSHSLLKGAADLLAQGRNFGPAEWVPDRST